MRLQAARIHFKRAFQIIFMTLYILRHASAGSPPANPLLDRKRGLDKEGKQQCLLIGAYLNAMRVTF